MKIIIFMKINFFLIISGFNVVKITHKKKKKVSFSGINLQKCPSSRKS